MFLSQILDVPYWIFLKFRCNYENGRNHSEIIEQAANFEACRAMSKWIEDGLMHFINPKLGN